MKHSAGIKVMDYFCQFLPKGQPKGQLSPLSHDSGLSICQKRHTFDIDARVDSSIQGSRFVNPNHPIVNTIINHQIKLLLL